MCGKDRRMVAKKGHKTCQTFPRVILAKTSNLG